MKNWIFFSKIQKKKKMKEIHIDLVSETIDATDERKDDHRQIWTNFDFMSSAGIYIYIYSQAELKIHKNLKIETYVKRKKKKKRSGVMADS